MTSLRDLVNQLGALVYEKPIERLQPVDGCTRALNMDAFTEQERRWIKEAEEQESSDGR